MIVSAISISNYRGFKKFDLEFGKSSTIIIGKNGCGKSNLLKALMKVLSIVPLSQESSFIKKPTYSFYDANRDVISGEFNYPIDISVISKIGNTRLSWSLFINSRQGKVKIGNFKDVITELKIQFHEFDPKLPVIAFFNDSFPHIHKSISTFAKEVINARGNIPRNFGYFEWDGEFNCSEIWIKRFINAYRITSDYKINLTSLRESIERNHLLLDDQNTNQGIKEAIKHNERIYSRILQDLEVLEQEIKVVEDTLIQFSQILSEAEKSIELYKVNVNIPEGLTPKVDFHFINNNAKIFFDSLPMGYKRIFSIVLDICYRNYILNQNNQASGIVIIDEIELHLHPKLASCIVFAFKKTFPKIQFIFSSHSPQVITSLKKDENNKIYRLDNEDNKIIVNEIDNYFGADYESTLRNVMEADFRSQVLENMINSYKIFRKYGHQEEAMELRNRIIEYAGQGNIALDRLNLE